MNRLLEYRPSWLTRLGLSLGFILMLTAGVILSAVFFALFLVVALVAGGWLWWQTRRLRQQIREPIEADYTVESRHDPIEGEYLVLEDRRQNTPVDRHPSRP